MTAMAEENRLTAEQLSTIEKLVKLSIVFTVVTPFLFVILLIALPPPPTEIATAKWYIVLFMGLSFCLFLMTFLAYLTMKYEPIQSHSKNMIVCVSSGCLVLFMIALYELLKIIIATKLCFTTLPPVYLFSVIWFVTYVLFLIYVAVMVWKIISHLV
jgi:hypothetical protein